jgi:hypothetical protein
MSYYYSVTAAGTADKYHGPYDTIQQARSAAKADAAKRGYSTYYLTVVDDSQNYKVVYEENSIPDTITSETVYYYDLTSQDTDRPGNWGKGESFGSEKEARGAMATTIRRQQISSYSYQIQKWSTGDKSVTVIESDTVLAKGWGAGAKDPDAYYYRISSPQLATPIVSPDYATYKEARDHAVSEGLDYRYSLDSGKVELYKRPAGTVKEENLGVYYWGAGKYPANWKTFDSLVEGGGDAGADFIEGQDWQMWAAIATVIMVIIMMAVFVKSRGAASG